MIHQMWYIMMLLSTVYACATGNGAAVAEAALQGCENAVSITLKLCAGYLFYCGMTEIASGLHMEESLARLLQPLLKRLMPSVRKTETLNAVAMNLALNGLGLGNAATPAGMEAMRCMKQEMGETPTVRHDMYLFLILNAAGLQLLPTGVLAMRAAAGSRNVNAVLLPVAVCTAASCAVSVGLGMLCRRREVRRHR